MTKRSCPFDTHCAPLLKIHVSPKEQTSCKKFMENIWNKTQELLLEGAKKQFDEQNTNNSDKEERKCDFCLNVNDKDVHECTICSGAFCSNCSLDLYKETDTERICLSCAE